MTSIFDHEVGTDEQGTRLDAFVAGLGIDELASRSAAVRLIESGRILVNDQPTTKKRIVIAGDMVHIEIPPRSGENADLEYSSSPQAQLQTSGVGWTARTEYARVAELADAHV